ncbi:CP family cyanate transporter-like MFS transporter [Gordonia humi]|uniref:CP family cyanate transporter-like MFS transporter n=1 Tax=Gordonia humi TaxID=686429 RepID=A0A840EYT5_9ACTN|nr:CP family cyanate transporter-like MFS transporter [Gordonia humi]
MTTTTPQRRFERYGSGGLRGRVIVLVAIVVFAFSLRTAVTSFTPLLERVSVDIGFGDTIKGLLGMLPTLAFGVAGLVSPRLGRRFGIEQVTLAAVVITGVGIAARSFSQNVGVLIVLSCVALFGMGVGNILIPPLVKRYFADRIAPISTAYIVFVQAGTVIPAAVAIPLADATNWRISLGVWALVPLAALGPWLWVVRERRIAARAETPVPVEQSPTPATARIAMWRSPMAWGMTLMFGMTSAGTYAMFTWMPKIFTDAGGSESLGGTSVAIFSGVGLAATFVAPSLSTRFANPFAFTIVFAASWFAGFAGLMWAPLSAPWLWALLCGLGPTTFPMALTLINVRTRTSEASAALSGFAQGVGYLLACAGPMLFGVLHDVTGGWGAPFLLTVGMTLAMLCGAWVICKPRYLEDQIG